MNRVEILSEVMQQLRLSLESIDSELSALIRDLSNETKSSAGDKFETAREMIQQERVKLETAKSLKAQQLGQVNQFTELKIASNIAVGSIIDTSVGRFILGVPFGKIILLNNSVVFGLGATSPLAQLLLGKEVGTQVELNKIVYKIDSVY